jgi:hypothetical protein
MRFVFGGCWTAWQVEGCVDFTGVVEQFLQALSGASTLVVVANFYK